MRYRRALVPGGTFFFTVVTEGRRPLLADSPAVNCLRQAFRSVKTNRPFRIDAMVILPDHLHSIWTLPAEDTDYSVRWRLIKTRCTKHWPVAVRGEGWSLINAAFGVRPVSGSTGVGSTPFVTNWTSRDTSMRFMSGRSVGLRCTNPTYKLPRRAGEQGGGSFFTGSQRNSTCPVLMSCMAGITFSSP